MRMKTIDVKGFYNRHSNSYEEIYESRLLFFKKVIDEVKKQKIRIINCPTEYVPFLVYIGAEVDVKTIFNVTSLIPVSPTKLVDFVMQVKKSGKLRDLVEHYSTLLPELADALYKLDEEWDWLDNNTYSSKPIYCTCLSSFHRQEFKRLIKFIQEQYSPPTLSKIALIIPCSADKPYSSSKLHKKIDKAIDQNFGAKSDSVHRIVATGPFGLIPRDLENKMPVYDAGLPYHRRVHLLSESYMSKFRKAYSYFIFHHDYYITELEDAAKAAKVDYFITGEKSNIYLPLGDSPYITRLIKTLRKLI